MMILGCRLQRISYSRKWPRAESLASLPFYRFGFVLIVFTLLCICLPVAAQQQIPAASLDKLQNVFGMVRDRLYAKNEDYWHNGQYERSIAMLRLIAQMDPADCDAYDTAAWLMQNQSRDDEAEAFLYQGLWSNPNVYDMYYSLGYFLYMHERFDEAIFYLETAVSLGAPLMVSHLMAHAYEHAGYIMVALGIWAQLEALEPGNLVPKIQIDRIIRGEPPVRTPEMDRHARENGQ